MSKKSETGDTKGLEILKLLLDEWMHSLQSLEKEILKLEIHQGDIVLINMISGAVHNIKIEASFIGISEVIKLCYEMEVTLQAVKENQVKVKPELIDSLLAVVERIKDVTLRLKKCRNLERSFKHVKSAKNDHAIENLKTVRKNCMNEEMSCTSKDQMILAMPFQETETEQTKSIELLQSVELKKTLLDELKEQFLYESTEHIEVIENQLLIELEQKGLSSKRLNEMFRAVHSLKGGIGIYLAALTPDCPQYMGLKKFSDIVHAFESLLAAVRDKNYKADKNLIDICYKVMDFAKDIINAVTLDDWTKSLENGLIQEIEDYINRIDLFQQEENKNQDSEMYSVRSSIIENAKLSEQSPQKVDLKVSPNVQNQSIRVNQEKLDHLMNTISELVIAKNSFMHISKKLDVEYNLPEISKEVKQVGAYVNRISDELQNAIISIRMVEIRTVFQKMPRIVRDIAQSTGKKIQMIMEGESTEIDKTIIEHINDPLIHIIRNAADHGIEDAEERRIKGKPELGKIIVRAYNKNRYVYIEVEDDGRGIDVEQVKQKAIEKRFISIAQAEKMSPHQLINLIFYPGFSTAQKITEVSGRGVGMDIVKSNIEKIKGTISVESKVNVGTKMTIQLPLTLAVSQGLIVEVKGESYIFPLEYIVETVKISRNTIHEFDGKCFTYLRGEVIGIEWLSRIFLMGERELDKEQLNAVIITNGIEKCAVVVDKFKGEQEFVVKALQGHLAGIPGISGSTLLGNGKVILIVNPLDIFKLVN